MASNLYYKNGSVVKPQPQPLPRTGTFPRSHSSNAIPPTTTSTSLLPKGQIMPGRRVAKTTDDIHHQLQLPPPPPIPVLPLIVSDEDTSNSSVGEVGGEWGDDEDEDDRFLFLAGATQDAEMAEGIHGERQINAVPSPLRLRHPSATTNRSSKFPRMNSDEEIQSGNILMMRARLAEQETGTGTYTNSSVLGPSKEEMKKAEDRIKALETENVTHKNDVYKYKGEVATLRKINEKLREDQLVDVHARLSFRNESHKVEEELKANILKLQNELVAIRSDNVKLKFASTNGFKRKSLGMGNHSVVNSSSNSNMDISSATQNQTQPLQLSQTQHLSSPSCATTEVKPVSPKKDDTGVQTDESFLSKSLTPPPPTSNESNVLPPHPIIQELSWGSISVETREKIFQKIDQIVELQYQLILPTLSRVVKIAPAEIMRRLVRNVEMKSAFPGVVDTMFQWGMDQERKIARSISGLKEPQPVMLPSKFEPGTEYYVIRNGIYTSFKYGGIWGALSEVRGWLEKILKSLEGKNRFRLYEYNTLTVFWRLLFWGNELWRGLLFEEENEQLVLQNKTRWVKELEGWTGLVLKSDWRDYFAVDLEIEVRKLTLGILENIVTAGYFEQKKNRYEILYRILKDVLIHDAFRNITNIQHVLRIVNWSVSDVFIMKHLCYKTNETNTCLARLIGENVLKVCREAGPNDSVAVARLYLDYANLLETLMSEKPVSYYQSKYARQSVPDGEAPTTIQLHNSEEMVVDSAFCDDLMAASQFACPIKYSVEPIIQPMETDEDEEQLKSSACCWLDPSKYEDPYGRLKLCQCRKVLMGTAISLLRIVFGAWSERYLDYEKEMENQEILEQEELIRLELISTTPLPSRGTPPATVSNQNECPSLESYRIKQNGDRDRLDYLRKKKYAKERLLPIGQTFMRLPNTDWNWDSFIFQKKQLPVDNSSDEDTFLPNCILDLSRRADVFDLALSKGVVLMNFVQTKAENLAAALGTDSYKTYMMLKALLRLHMDQIHFTRIERFLLTEMTHDCNEDHLGVVLSHAGQDEHRNFKPASVDNPSVAYPIPLTPLSSQVPEDGEDWEELAAQAEKEMKLRRKTTDAEFDLLEREQGDYEEEEFVIASGPYTYRPIQQRLERKSKH